MFSKVQESGQRKFQGCTAELVNQEQLKECLSDTRNLVSEVSSELFKNVGSLVASSSSSVVEIILAKLKPLLSNFVLTSELQQGISILPNEVVSRCDSEDLSSANAALLRRRVADYFADVMRRLTW